MLERTLEPDSPKRNSSRDWSTSRLLHDISISPNDYQRDRETGWHSLSCMETCRGRKKLRPAAQAVTKSNRLQFCDAKDAAGKGLNKGDKFYWNVYSDVATAGTDLAEDDTMPETNFTVTQNSLTIGEMGNSVFI